MSLGAIFEAALSAQDACLAIELPHCVIGGLAVQRWGEPRFTADADFSVLVKQGAESDAIQGLLKQLSARIEGAEEFAIRTRVVLLAAKEANHLGQQLEARIQKHILKPGPRLE
jgi:hypothetical protein